MEIQLQLSEGFCTIDVEDNGSCLKSLRKKLEETEKKHTGATATIFRVPDSIRAADPKAYKPKIISLGPFHHGNPHLQEMEEVKLLYMGSLLAQNPSAGLDDYYREMKILEPQARSSYSGEIPMKSEEFIQLLMLDGCFIIQVFLKFLSHRKQQAALEGVPQQLFTQVMEEILPHIAQWAFPLLGTDMLRLENQLPFFVLESLYSLATAADGAEDYKISLPDLALDFLNSFLPGKVPESKSHPQFDHLLHLVHWCIEPSERRPPLVENCCSWLCHYCKQPPTHSIDPESVPCATELKAAGVNFKRNKAEDDGLLDVDFHYSCEILGVLRLTPLTIHDQTGDIFRNLVALEQCSPGVGSHVTIYAHFMDCLVDTPADVALLRREGLVVNMLGSDEDAAAMFNGLCKGVVFNLDTSYLSGLFRDATAHCQSRGNRWRAMLMQDYFSSPWSLISLVGAVIILSLTVVQTTFAVRSYFHPPPQPPS